MKTSGRGHVLDLAQLMSKLLTEARRITAGVKKREEVWTILEERYEDRYILIMSAINKVETLKLPDSRA